MVRAIRLVVAGLFVFLAAAALGMRVASDWGPERTRTLVEIGLGEAVGAPVAVAQARLHLGVGAVGSFSWMKGVLLDATGVEARLPAPAGSAPDAPPAPELRVERLQAELAPLALLRGHVEVRSLALDGVHVSIRDPLAPGAAGATEPETGTAPAEAGATPPPEPILDALERLAAAAEQLLAARVGTDDVAIERAAITLDGPPLAEGAPPWRIALRDVSGRLRLRAPGRRAGIALTGRLEQAGGDARLTFELQRDARGALSADVTVAELALASTTPALAALLHDARLGGEGTLRISARREQKDVFHVTAAADARDVDGTLPRMGDAAPMPVALARASAGIELDVDPERVRVARAFARSEHTELGLSGEIERPLRMASSTQGEFTLDHFDVANRDALIAFLPPRQSERLEAVLRPLRSGRVEDARVSGTASLRDWLRAFDGDRPGLLPDAVEARARFRGFAVRAGEGETLSDLSGRVVWRGDRIELQGVRGRRAGRDLPVLDASLSGMSNLAANASWPEVPDEDAPLMLGLRPMYDIVVDPTKPPGEMPRELLLSLDYVIHPTLVWPMRNIFARANPGEDGIRLLLEHGVWGRVPVRAEGIWTMQRVEGQRRLERVALRVEARPPLEGLEPLVRDGAVWARGRWHLDAHNLGDWRVLSSTGAFHASGEHVRLVTYDLELGVAGRALGEGTVDFSKPDELPYWTTVRVADAKAPGIVDKIGFEPHEATGDVVIDGQLRGELRPGRRVLAGMEGRLQVSARDGAILKRLPVLLALAKATDTFNPFGSREEMRYSEIDADLRLARGVVHADELRIDGSDLRLLATGHVDALDPDHPVQAVVGVFFFRALDRVIGVVPVLSDLILGEDESLMGAYVELSGAWAHPEASLVPLKTVASGPASIAMEGVPRFVRKAITAIQAALERPTPDVASPPPPGKGS